MTLTRSELHLAIDGGRRNGVSNWRKWRDRAITAGVLLLLGGPIVAGILKYFLEERPPVEVDDAHMCMTRSFMQFDQSHFREQVLVASMEHRGASAELWENPETFAFSLVWTEPDYGNLDDDERFSCYIINGRTWHLLPDDLVWAKSPPVIADPDHQQVED